MVPANGQGLNPLLQNFYMIIHPPMLYLGFVSFVIPFAFAFAALVTGRTDDRWIRLTRRWTPGCLAVPLTGPGARLALGL